MTANSRIDILKKVKNGEISVGQAVEQLNQIPASRPDESNCLYYGSEWKRSEPGSDEQPEQMESLLIFDGDDVRFQWMQDRKSATHMYLVKPAVEFKEEDHSVFLLDPRSEEHIHQLIETLKKRDHLPTHVLHCLTMRDLSSKQTDFVEGQEVNEKHVKDITHGLRTTYFLTQALIRARISHPCNILFVSNEASSAPVLAAVDAFGRVASLESSRLRFQSLLLDKQCEREEEFELLKRELSSIHEGYGEIRIDAQGRWKKTATELIAPETNPKLDVRQDGAYLITGGLGGLGKLFTRHLVELGKVHLVLLGRSPLQEAGKSHIRELESRGAKVMYARANVTEKAELTAVIEEAKKEFGSLRGVIHVAGILEDSLLLHKETDAFDRVLASKVWGTITLDEVTKDEPLDFFIGFSSIGSHFPNPGQADYAAANRFMDEYLHARATRLGRPGRSLSVNWPLWESGGMEMPLEIRENLRREVGLSVLPTEKGLSVFHKVFQLNANTAGVLHGDVDKLRELLTSLGQKKATRVSNKKPGNHAISQKQVEEYVREIVAEKAKLPLEEIDPALDLEVIGLDSFMVTSITNRLELDMGTLPKTLLYEYQNVRKLAAYLLENHESALGQMQAFKEELPERAIETDRLASPPLVPEFENKQSASAAGDIAIIGIHGRYPDAEDLNAFWENLLQGKDSITVIPEERWKLAGFYNENRRNKGTSYGKWGGFLRGIDEFDGLFFHISPREAETMDPQERLFLETAWGALEDAGYVRHALTTRKDSELDRNVGVFVGVTSGQYQYLGVEAWTQGTFLPAYSQYWSIANRVSYTCNFTGPSLAIDTACSASLSAIHLACESLRSGESAMAIAGGVNINIHPSKYIALSDMQFLSSDGRCRAFGADGDGYVPGEGVGAVVLKPLAKAIEDRDHIYGVIKGTAINHGGKTNGYSVPSPQGQALVISRALKVADIHPATISYIESHGTGTSLGDPIEIAGLAKAFKRDETVESSCAIGSVKSNIGHLESAAGIASLTKVVLQMKHRMLVPSLHADPLNPNIDFAQTPFFVSQSASEWSSATIPRRSAVSSFGAGGANAHIIVEEYVSEQEVDDHDHSRKQGAMMREAVVFSARNHEGLLELAKSMKEHIELHRPRLGDVAYTLQLGRESFESRLGVVVTDIDELIVKLGSFLRKETSIPGLYQGHVKIGRLAKDPEDLITLLDQKKLDEALDYWVQGGEIPWEKMERTGHARRVPLPLTPLQRQQYWVPQLKKRSESLVVEQLHPLLDKVIPSLKGAEFSRTIRADEPIVAQHKVQGMAVLPGVAHLEMAIAASELSTGRKVSALENVVWISPVQITEDAVEVRVRLQESGEDSLLFEVSLEGSITCSKGTVLLAGEIEKRTPLCYSLPAIAHRCNQGATKQEIYETFERQNISYGSFFQRLEKLSFNDSEALGYVMPEQQLHDEYQQYHLHPGIIDGCLHALSAFRMNAAQDEAMVPFSIGRVDIFDDGTAPCMVYARRIGDDARAGGSAHFDIDIVDKDGKPLIRLGHFGSRRLKMEGTKAKPASPMAIHAAPGTEEKWAGMYYRPVWHQSPLTSRPPQLRRVLICGHRDDLGIGQMLADYFHFAQVIQVDLAQQNTIEEWEKSVADTGMFDAIFFLGGVYGSYYSSHDVGLLDELLELGTIALFRLLKVLGSKGMDDVHLYVMTNDLLYVTSEDHAYQAFSGALDGLIRTATREYKRLRAAYVDVRKSDVQKLLTYDQRKAWVSRLLGEQLGQADIRVAWRGPHRYVQRLEQIEFGDSEQDQAQATPYRAQGAYMLLGGLGGLGLEIGRFLAKTYQAKIAIVGRSEHNAERMSKLKELEVAGATQVLYIQADLADEEQMAAAVEKTRRAFGAIHGVIHTAIVLKDGAIPALREEDFRAALSPKVRGTVVLNRVLEAEPLDFMAFFSSGISFTAAPGQSNYTAGCTFKDTFAQHLQVMKKRQVKIINWGFWGETGVVATQAYRDRMKLLGVAPISAKEGITAFQQIMSGNVNQVMAMKLRVDLAQQLGINYEHCAESVAASEKGLIHTATQAIHAFRDDIKRSGEKLGDDALEQMEKLSRERLLLFFQKAGLLCYAHEQYLISDIRSHLRISSTHERLFQAMLGILERAEFIRVQGEKVEATLSVERMTAEERGRRVQLEESDLVTQTPDIAAYVNLVKTCTDAFPAVLSGEIPAVDVLFPKGSTALVEGVYKDNRRADYFNQMLAQAIISVVAEQSAKEQDTRLLEVGSGTGGTSLVVLEALRNFAPSVHYDFTDISSQLIRLAKQRFAHRYPYADFKLLDIEKDVRAQGFDAGANHIVLATNVLHATSNMRRTISELKKLLKKNGMFIINELMYAWDFATLTFGLTSGWWSFEDADVRLPHSPLLSKEEWRRLLEEAGFVNVQIFGVPTASHHLLDQGIIVAQSDGWIQSERVTQEKSSAGPAKSLVNEETFVPKESKNVQQPSISLTELTTCIADVLKMNANELETDIDFDRYGVDSLVAMDIIGRLEVVYGNLPKDLLFTYTTVQALADYLGQLGTTAQTGSVHTKAETDKRSSSIPVEQVRPQMTESHEVSRESGGLEPIAVVGMHGRFPGARDVEQFWSLLKEKRSGISEIPRDRWAHENYYSFEGKDVGTSYGKWGGFLEEVDKFDPLFFGIAPRDAAKMDPQERLFLQAAWGAIEDAGYTPSRLNEQAAADGGEGVGVFVGVMYGPYQLLAAEEWGKGNRIEAHSSYWSIANRVSYVLDFQGPSMAIDTACSSSLTAIHKACESIRIRECRAAVAGGVNLILHPSHSVGLSKLKMLSKGSQCQSFGKEADGLVPGEGVGAILLKPLSSAMRDGDHIYGVIRSSAVNSDGRGQGYAVPNPQAQARLITKALKCAGIDPRTISYVEAQAVGSELADRIEVEALGQVFGGQKNDPIRKIGSLKPNTGHLEAASGVAQVMKVLLQMKHEMLLPTIQPAQINPELALQEASLQLQAEYAPWNRPVIEGVGEVARRAGISSFGAGGSNAHLIVEEAPSVRVSPESVGKAHIIILSARTSEQLREYAMRIKDYVVQQRNVLRLDDISYTLCVGREPMAYRLACTVRSLEELRLVLERFVSGHSHASFVSGKVVREYKGQMLDARTVYEKMNNGDFESVAKDWVSGKEIDWQAVHANQGYRRVSLPGYPFMGEKYWLELTGHQSVDTLQANSVKEVATIDQGLNLVHSSNYKEIEVQRICLEIMANLLAIKPEYIDVDENLGDYGFDSIALTAFAQRIGERFSTEISPTLFFEYTTIQEMARYLIQSTGPTMMEREPQPLLRSDASYPSPQPSATITNGEWGAGVAIIGVSGRFPGSSDLDGFWRILFEQESAITEIPADRFDYRDVYGDPMREEGKTNSKWGGFIDEVDCFDAAYFNISPREASLMDPQQRLFLQEVWRALQDAGYTSTQVNGTRTGVFVGVAAREYAHLLEASGMEIDGQAASGNSHSILANRVSYLLDLRGPSEPIDTACSSSLVAVHRAVSSIQSGECDMAIAGGVNLLLTPAGFLAFGKSGMLANDGHCKTFDAGADGYVRGEGVGVVILKPLEKALADQDYIYGVVRGTAVNHGGRANSLTAPNTAAQAEVIMEACQKAKISPNTITYVEAHGTGTALGDPVEINGLTRAFAKLTGENKLNQAYCGLGAVKTNIGHLETAAGIASLIKVLLSMKNRTLPGLVHFKQQNPQIQLENSPFYLVTKTEKWNRLVDEHDQEIPRRAGISSFGFGGVNAHVIVEEYDRSGKVSISDDNENLLLLSARDQEQLHAYARNFVTWLENSQQTECLADIAYTLQVGREALDSRLAVIARSKEEVLLHLKAYLAGTTSEGRGALFTGQVEKHKELLAILNHDLNHQAYVADLYRSGQMQQIALLWAKGLEVKWDMIHTGVPRKKVPLPAYPFAKKRYWITTLNREQKQESQWVKVEASEKNSEMVVPKSVDKPKETVPPARIAPADIRDEIRQLFAEFLNLEPEEISYDKEFTSYGVDSIAGLRIMQRIHDRYGDEIPMLTIIEQPTLSQFASFLQEHYIKAQTAPLQECVEPEWAEPLGSIAATVEERVEEDTKPAEAVLIPFQPEGEQEALFGIHGDTGEVSWLMPIAEFRGSDHPTFGLECIGFDGSSPFHASVSDMAKSYAQAILTAKTDGKISLAACGTGAVIAMEVAECLHANGKEVSKVILIDPQLPNLLDDNDESELEKTVNILSSMWEGTRYLEQQEVLSWPKSQRVERAVDFIERSACPPLKGQKLRSWLERCLSGSMAIRKAFAGYQPVIYSGQAEIHVVRSEPDAESLDREMNVSVSLFVPIGSKEHVVPYDRKNILSSVALKRLFRKAPWAKERSSTGDYNQQQNSDDQEKEIVVPINKQGSKRPTFWIHTLLGDVSYGMNLSHHLGLEYPVYGLEQFHVDGSTNLVPDIEEMASIYIQAMKKVQPEGPYTIGGYSFGGVVAYEMARQLSEEGYENTEIVLIDAILPGTEVFHAIDTGALGDTDFSIMALILIGNTFGNRWGAKEYILIDDISGQDSEWQIKSVAKHLYKKSDTPLDYDQLIDLVRTNFDTITSNNNALLSYQPKPIESSVSMLLFHASLGFVGPNNPNDLPEMKILIDDRTNGFGAFVLSEIEILDISADHYTICNAENIQAVTFDTKRWLERKRNNKQPANKQKRTKSVKHP